MHEQVENRNTPRYKSRVRISKGTYHIVLNYSRYLKGNLTEEKKLHRLATKVESNFKASIYFLYFDIFTYKYRYYQF